MTGCFSKSLCASAFLSIAIAVLVVGCNHPRATTKGTTAASNEVSQLSQALVGKRITIRGKFFVGKQGDGIQLENEAVYLIQMNPKPVFEPPLL